MAGMDEPSEAGLAHCVFSLFYAEDGRTPKVVTNPIMNLFAIFSQHEKERACHALRLLLIPCLHTLPVMCSPLLLPDLAQI